MSFDIKIDPDNRRVEIQIAGQDKATIRGIRQGFYFLGKDLVQTTKEGIQNPPKTGKIYVVKGLRQTSYRHQASSVGEYPANLSGELAQGVRFEVRGSRQLVFGAEAPYAPYLELGTRNAGPRPLLYKSVMTNQANASRLLERELKKATMNEGQ